MKLIIIPAAVHLAAFGGKYACFGSRNRGNWRKNQKVNANGYKASVYN
jgi:hypothetical protein